MELDKHGVEALTALTDRDVHAAIFYASLSTSFWEQEKNIISLAHAVSGCFGAAGAAQLLGAKHSRDRSDNFKYAMAHFLVLSGQFSLAQSVTTDAQISCCEDIRYVVSDVRMNVELGKHELAIEHVRLQTESIIRNVWASMMVVRYLSGQPGASSVLIPLFLKLMAAETELNDEDKINLGFYCALAFENIASSPLSGLANRGAAEIAAFVSNNSLNSSVGIAEQLMSHKSFRHEGDVMALIERALAERQGFSLIRIGDGEGRFLPPIDNYTTLYEGSLRKAQEIWFWNSRRMPGRDFFARMKDAILCSDIVGFSPPLRIRMEAKNTYLGYLGVVNGNNFVLSQIESAGFLVTYNWINVLIAKPAFLEGLIERIGAFSIISPHANIAVEGKFAGAKINHIVIPSENNKAVVDRSIKQPHYPDVFDEICEKIRACGSGLFLVAGGIFGKIYCAEIRKAGGVAIDIGSVADQWVGLKSR